MKLVEVSGVYERGTNSLEADEVIAAAAEFMRHDRDKSLGIVAVNQKQKDIIQEKMDLLSKQDPAVQSYIERWQEDELEAFFVKNLENVQGDERDVIFISTVYGPNAAGAQHNRFGPINSIQGHRRLNVLFTRARSQVKVFSSLKPELIQVEEATKWGVKALKSYLVFARTGRFAEEDVNGREPDSDFERWFVSELKQRGYSVVPQLGVAGYYLDIAVRHPDKPGSYILGVECDGATYHSAKSARDRDRLRQDVLENLGWTIHRVWSTDWFKNPQWELKRLVDRIESLRADA